MQEVLANISTPMGLIFYSLVRFKHKNTRELD